ncbi:hypothetical protein HMPREF0513_00064 [Limosilactobacillus fermentum 28-3-CHN]|uniref:Uncharacterized protein n=2 Tax=Limosilactobacillus fermentum TaxID=1613 RepID=D0DR50_LIMFE|nr:hypothetical protein HMPREF0513_00064 [Limosilactobacillus fermentum 28-3-CHN]EQC60069.1 hypothetical protein N219_05795 [Limosilactobacillus fermentum MTCC 8711]ESS01106.1 hypothetical protein NB22_06495 [Limosilactobacillus fermentum NB-22]
MRTVFETNYFGPVRMIQEALPLLRKSVKGVIVNLSQWGSTLKMPVEIHCTLQARRP